MNKLDIKRSNKSKIAKFILEKESTSKAEIASALELSMPTVLTNVKELLDAGIIEETGEYESTGGRRAKAISIKPDIKYAAGIDITQNHISYVLINVCGEIIDKLRVQKVFQNTIEFYEGLSQEFEGFLKKSGVEEEKVLGVGVSLPGIIDQRNGILLKSHVLGLNDLNLQVIRDRMRFETVFDNDANCAAVAEIRSNENILYLSLKNTVGGSFYIHNDIYAGDHFRSGEFGHMILVPGGRRCYCGKKGCMDAYCAASVLAQHADDNLERFFEMLDAKEDKAIQAWEEYLEYLAIGITNLRMAYDCDIILGGDVGAYMPKHMNELTKKVLIYNKFDNDSLYIRPSQYKNEASEIGIALTFVERYFDAMS